MEPPPPTDPAPPVTAFDRVQTREPAPRTRDTSISLSRWIRSLAVFGLVVLGTWAAFRWLGPSTPAEESDLILRMSEAASDFRVGAAMTGGDEASAWVLDQYGWPIVIPDLPGLQLVGAGETALARLPDTGRADDAEWVTPTFRYVGMGTESVVLYAYDYAQLDRSQDWMRLPTGVYGRLAEDVPFDTRRIDSTGDYAVTWRRRAVLYTAVTSSEEVVERLTEELSVEAGP